MLYILLHYKHHNKYLCYDTILINVNLSIRQSKYVSKCMKQFKKLCLHTQYITQFQFLLFLSFIIFPCVHVKLFLIKKKY